MARLNAYSEGNHCLSRNHGDRRCMFLFKLSQCALFQLEFVSAAYYLWQHMHCKIITRSNHCISHLFTCLRKHKVNDSVYANFQEKRCFSKCTILIINPWAHSECMYIPFLIFTAYITISVKCKLTWVAPRVTLVAYRAWLPSFRSSYILCIQAEKRQQRKARKDFTFCLFPAREY